MRLLLVSFFYEHDHGGAEMVAREARRLMTEKLGWEIDVLCLAGGPDRGAGIHRIPPPLWWPGSQWYKHAILFLQNSQLDRWFLGAVQRARVRAKDYDAIFCPDMNAIVLAHALAKAADKPLFTWCQEVVPKRMDADATRATFAPLINIWLRGRDAPWKKDLAASAHVAGVSDFITDRCRAFAGDGTVESDAKFTTLYQPVEDYFLQPPARPVATEGPAKVLFYGRLSAEKGIDLLLAAWRKLQPNATLSILGMDGPLRTEVERATGDDIHLLQHVAHVDVPKLISQHDIVVCPSRVEESLCRTALEARLLERVVVASQSGAIPEVVSGYPLAHSTEIRTDDATAIGNLTKTLQTALEERRPLEDAERDVEKTFREKFLPVTFVHQFRMLTEI